MKQKASKDSSLSPKEINKNQIISKKGNKKTDPPSAKELAPQVLVPQARPELVIGIVGPIGVDLQPLLTALREGLAEAKYFSHEVRLSKLIETIASVDHQGEPEHRRIKKLMDLGTLLRESSNRGDAAAILAMAEISRIRQDELPLSDSNDEGTGHAYLLRSLKHPAEVERLRSVYGRGFFLVSAYAPRDMRVSALAERIARSRNGKKMRARSFAELLVERDEAEDGTNLGQDVQDAFPLADLFVDARSADQIKSRVTRFLHLTFGNRLRTPTKDEHGMFHAQAAALRSADLNRQVGAAIMQNGSDIVTVGCNDVPKFGGDQYWEGDSDDSRDFTRGVDSGAEQRVQMLGRTARQIDRGRVSQAKQGDSRRSRACAVDDQRG